MVDSKILKMLPMFAKITFSQLNWSNYSDWSTIIKIYIMGIEKEEHSTDDPLVIKQNWLLGKGLMLEFCFKSEILLNLGSWSW